MPVRYLFLDEVDAYPPSADDEGDPVALAEARTRTFSWRRKVFLASTPTIKGLSRIEREYEASDQRRFFVPCPHCGERQWLRFERLRWEKGKPETAAYYCEGCEQPIAEHHKTQMLAAGEWRPATTSADPLTIGFHLSSLYSPVGWLSWERIAREWEASQTSDEAKRSFINTVLGETWVETGEAPDWQRLYDRREDYRRGTVPMDGLFLTAGADVQKDRIEVSVWAWGRGLESWLIDHVVIDGGPERAEAWATLTELLGETWPHPSGAFLGLAKLAIDTGYEAPAVYAWARRMGSGAGGRGQGCRRLQPGGAGRRADVRRCDRGRPQDPPRRPAVDGRGRDLQERDLPLPAACRRRRTVRRLSGRLCASAARRRRRMGEAAGRRAADDGEDQARLHPAGMAEAAGSATRRSTAGSTPAPPPGSPASIAGPSANGWSWKGNSASRRQPVPSAGDKVREQRMRADPLSESARHTVPLAGRTAAELAAAWIIQSKADMTWSQAELDALRKAYASGTLRVSYDGRSVEYGSAADLLRRIRTIEARWRRPTAGRSRKRSFAAFRKG